jgi:hypothetical protein
LLQNGFGKFCGQGPSKEIRVPDLQQSQWLRQLWLEKFRVESVELPLFRLSDLLTRVVAIAKLPLYFGLEVASQPTLERIRSNNLLHLIVIGFRRLGRAYLIVAANRGDSSEHRANGASGCRQEIHQAMLYHSWGSLHVPFSDQAVLQTGRSHPVQRASKPGFGRAMHSKPITGNCTVETGEGQFRRDRANLFG